jgi:hypothetical protein
MKSDEEQINKLEQDVERLQREADRYRRASEDCLQQLGWCIGYFAGVNRPRIAHSLAVNVGHIRQDLLAQHEVALPVTPE